MTAARPPSPSRTQQPIEVVGVDAAGQTVVRGSLRHGEDPVDVLAAAGFTPTAVRGVAREPGGRQALTFTFAVAPAPAGGAEVDGEAPPPVAPRWDEGLVPAPGEVPRRVQRVAAYAVVTSDRGILLTQFSDRTNSPGLWGLPGGGLDPGESPDEAVVREIWEETGQRVAGTTLVLVQSSHWVGRAPSGVLEDFHALRVIYTARCPQPGEVVVHDVGGTTSQARWVPPADVAELPLTAIWRATLLGVTGRGLLLL